MGQDLGNREFSKVVPEYSSQLETLFARIRNALAAKSAQIVQLKHATLNPKAALGPLAPTAQEGEVTEAQKQSMLVTLRMPRDPLGKMRSNEQLGKAITTGCSDMLERQQGQEDKSQRVN